MIETRRWGAPTPTTLVLLHEGLGCIELWRDFPDRLAAASGLHVFAWSRRGYGRSAPCPLPRPLDYMRREDAGAVLDAHAIGRCVLVGHSDGASIAALHAAGGDPRVAGAVLIAPHYFVEEMCIAAIAEARQAYLAGNLRPRLAKYHAHVDVAFHGWNAAWLDPGFRDFDIRAETARIAIPVLQIQGTEDPYGTMAQPAAFRGPRVRTATPAAKHAPHLEAPDATLAAIVAFLREL
jgi:pimeloyl-ACP methyl ester carboxylesterase